ncbi:MAG: C-type lectin domain-containing protein [Sandaracinaceae bacterium]
MRASIALAALIASGCSLNPPDGVFRCETDTECPEGLTCGADRLCYRAQPDAGRDGATRRDGGSLDAAVDAGPDAAGFDASGMDAGDAGPGEDCVDDRFADDDGDGVIDEGCTLFVGTVHAPIAAYPAPGPDPTPSHDNHALSSPWLTPDGLRLYFAELVDRIGQLPMVAERPTLDAPFGAPDAVMVMGGGAFSAVALSDDELVMVAQADASPALVLTSRLARTDAFDPPIAATPAPPGGASQSSPTLRYDGLELLYVEADTSTHRLMRATRADRTTAFGTPTVVLDTGTPLYPMLSEDGRTLFVTLDTGLHTLSRPSVDATFGLTPTPVSAFVDASFTAEAPFLRAATREIVFQARADDRAPAGRRSIFRARACRERSCPLIQVDCTPPDRRGWDGLVCYHETTTTGAVGLGRTSCSTWGGTLAAIHSERDRIDLDMVRTSVDYVSLERFSATSPFANDNGEPFLYAPWGSVEPSSDPADRCVVLRADGLDAADCTSGRLSLCASRLWPTW